jgi:hypothetical protein
MKQNRQYTVLQRNTTARSRGKPDTISLEEKTFMATSMSPVTIKRA